MRRPLLRLRTQGDRAAASIARVDTRTKDLTKRLEPGDVAVIDHLDIDTVAAEALVGRRPSAVLNAAASISGRYPNVGPQILVDAGITLIDSFGPQLLSLIADGQPVRISGAEVWAGTELVGAGQIQSTESIAEAMAKARLNLADQLAAFAENTMDYLRRERELLLDGVGVPEIRTQLAGRHALVVVRGYHYREDLQTLRHYVREYRPVIIGVDGGADAVLEAGLKLQLIVGDMDSVSDRALTSGAEVVVHAYRDGRAPGLERVRALGVEPVVFPATGTSEDIAMLLADDRGAELIVAVGTHATLVEFLDKGRSGMASTFLTRLRVGGKLVDAKGVSRLYRSRIASWHIGALIMGGLLALAAAMWSTPAGLTTLGLIGARIDDIISWVQGLL